MTDDLVERLRAETDGATVNPDGLEAADRIEELERALEEIANGARDADKSYVSLFYELQSEARVALDKTDD